jgi:hypothetical protein
MKTNLPAKTAMAMVVLTAAAAEMVVVGSGRRVWMRSLLQSLRCNAATNLQQNKQRWSVVIPAATMVDCLMAILDNLGATKTTATTNFGSWQKDDDTGGYYVKGNNRLPSSPTNGEDNGTTASNNQAT